MLNLNYALRHARKSIRKILRKDEKRILIACILVISILAVAAVSAAVYNSMSMGSSIGVT